MKNLKLIIFIFLCANFLSCSRNDENNIVDSKINPPQFLQGNWETVEGVTEFNITDKNFIEITDVYNISSTERVSYDYSALFDNNQHEIEETTTSNTYEINISKVDDSVEFLPNSLFRIPLTWHFELMQDGRIVVTGVGYSSGSYLLER